MPPRTRRRETAPPGGSTLTGTRVLRENLPRPATTAPGSVPAAVSGPRRGRFSGLRKFEPRFIADIVSELKKVTWPSFTETRYLTGVVAVVAVVIGAFLGGIDLVFGWVIEKIFF